MHYNTIQYCILNIHFILSYSLIWGIYRFTVNLEQRCKIALWLFKALNPDYIISAELLHIEDTISVYYDFGQGETLAVVQFNYFLSVKLLFLTAKLTSSPSTSLTLSVTLLCMDMMVDVFQVFFHCDTLAFSTTDRELKWHAPPSPCALWPICSSCHQLHVDQYLSWVCSNRGVFV